MASAGDTSDRLATAARLNLTEAFLEAEVAALGPPEGGQRLEERPLEQEQLALLRQLREVCPLAATTTTVDPSASPPLRSSVLLLMVRGLLCLPAPLWRLALKS